MTEAIASVANVNRSKFGLRRVFMRNFLTPEVFFIVSCHGLLLLKPRAFAFIAISVTTN